MPTKPRDRERTLIVVLDPGEEVLSTATEFARAEQIAGASFTALGAFSRATLGWFDFAQRSYRPIEVDEQCEALSLLGDIALDEHGAPSLHIHAVVGLLRVLEMTNQLRPLPSMPAPAYSAVGKIIKIR